MEKRAVITEDTPDVQVNGAKKAHDCGGCDEVELTDKGTSTKLLKSAEEVFRGRQDCKHKVKPDTED